MPSTESLKRWATSTFRTACVVIVLAINVYFGVEASRKCGSPVPVLSGFCVGFTFALLLLQLALRRFFRAKEMERDTPRT